MAVNESQNKPATPMSRPRRMLVGTHVVVATIIVVAIVAVMQAIAHSLPGVRMDMTSTGINSLSEATENLLRNLDENVRLTSLYFETDLEDKDQQLYRRTMSDLLGLYAATQRSRVTADWINPLSDHEAFKKLTARLRDKEKFRTEVEPWKEAVTRYQNELGPRISELLQSELHAVEAINVGLTDATAQGPIGQIQSFLMQLSRELDGARQQLDAMITVDNPQYGNAVNILRAIYRDLARSLKDIPRFTQGELARNPNLPPDAFAFLRDAHTRYAEVVGAIEGEITRVQELEPLRIDELLGQLQPNANPVVVETDNDAVVVDFSSIWPPMDQGRAPGRSRFQDRAFKGEEQITAAILRATLQERPAVIFVRYGGMPLFFGGMPNQMPALYARIKKQLEDVNFVVEEWDLKSSDSPPVIDPPPSRTLFVVLKPTPPNTGPMGQTQPGEQPFTDSHKEKLLAAMGESPRAIFVAGWHPGPFGAIPASYEFNDYLEQTWGLSVDTGVLLIETVNTQPGQYNIGRRDFFNITQPIPEVTDHIIVSGAQARLLALPWCAPVRFSTSAPEGVTREVLIEIPRRDEIWGIRNFQAYVEQLNERDYLTLAEGDLREAFDVAAVAEKGEGKIVLISARDFAVDEVAFAPELAVTAQGFALRTRYPGNAALLVNALHWLNDRTEFMNIGKPIDAAVLNVAKTSTVKTVQAMAIFAWPAVALVFGGAVWWVRRR